MSSEKPIIFTDWSVRAILDNRKTQTRRVVALDVPGDADEVFTWFGGELRNAPNGCAPDGLWARKHGADGYLQHLGQCPYGSPGDRLWVQEAWDCALWGDFPMVGYRAGGEPKGVYADETADWACRLPGQWWRPSKMPPDYSRLTLEITGVRVERLQEISEADAEAEGCGGASGPDLWITPVSQYRKVWDDIHQKDGHTWESNPWVWIVEFKKL